ncbi:MAG: hypothetical protein GF353_11785 [Candidatus Lokiarchaeota archaeon]|nr:hypothetical protein [Candidatus Lokiarchaeota archaeon]
MTKFRNSFEFRYKVLHIVKSKKQTTIPEIRDILGIKKRSNKERKLYKIVDYLVKHSYLKKKEKNPRRKHEPKYLISITPKAKELLE